MTDQWKPDPWMSILCLISVRLYTATYGHLPSFGFHMTWDPTTNSPILIGTPGLGNHLIIGVYLLLSFLYFPIIFKNIFYFSVENTLSFGILLLFLTYALLNAYVRHKIIHPHSLLFLTINKMLQGAIRCKSKKITKSNLMENVDVAGTLSLFVVIAVIVVCTPAPFLLWMQQLDPITITLQEYSAPRISFFAQSIILLLQFFMFGTSFRDTTIILFIALWNCNNFSAYLKTLRKLLSDTSTTNNPSNLILYNYVQLRLLYGGCRDEFDSVSMALVIAGQLTLTFFIWVAINCFGLVPVFMVAACAFVFLLGLGMTWYLLNIATEGRLQSLELIADLKIILGQVAAGKIMRHAYLRRCWLAQQPLPINCGQQFPFTRDSILNYLNVLNTNVTDALLLLRV